MARKLPGLQYLRASCSMHVISRYCETRPKIIDFILFVGIRDVDHLKERLVEEWARFDQKIIDGSINQWRKRLRACVSADGGHFEQTIKLNPIYGPIIGSIKGSFQRQQTK